MHYTLVDTQLAAKQPLHRQRENPVLFGEYARRKRRLRIIGPNWYSSLYDDRPRIEIGRHEVNRRTMHFYAGLERACMRIEAGKGGQQRRMNVDEAPFIAPDESRRQNAHESSQDHRLWSVAINQFGERLIE